MKTEPKCVRCKYYYESQCRRYPPTVIIRHDSFMGRTDKPDYLFPLVKEDVWWGEYK